MARDRDMDRLVRELRRGDRRRRDDWDSVWDDITYAIDDLFDSRYFWVAIAMVALAAAADHFLGWSVLPTLWGWVTSAASWGAERLQGTGKS